MSHRDFLVEIGTEELPPKALRELELSFAGGMREGLKQAVLAHGEILSFATPRRLAIWVKRLADRQPDQHVKRRGPPLSAAFDASGAPTRAAIAFAESCGAPVESLQRLDEGKGPALFFIGSKPGVAAVELLPGIVQSALDALPVPKRMRWGAADAEFVRPVHWVVMLYGSEVVPATILGIVDWCRHLGPSLSRAETHQRNLSRKLRAGTAYTRSRNRGLRRAARTYQERRKQAGV